MSNDQSARNLLERLQVQTLDRAPWLRPVWRWVRALGSLGDLARQVGEVKAMLVWHLEEHRRNRSKGQQDTRPMPIDELPHQPAHIPENRP